MNEMQPNNQQPSNQQGNVVPPNWNMPTMWNPWMVNPWMAYGMNQNRQGGNPMFGMPMNNQPNNGPMQPQVSKAEPQNSEQKPSNNRVVIPCGIVANQQEIRPADIPMDDGFGMFLKQDQSEVYIKEWSSDGKINTKTFALVPEAVPMEEPDPNMMALNARFEKIENAIIALSQALNQNNQSKKGNQKPNGPKIEVQEGGVDL